MATVTIASGIVPGGGEADPDTVGARYHRLYGQPDRVEEVVGDTDAFRAFVARRLSGSGAPAPSSVTADG